METSPRVTALCCRNARAIPRCCHNEPLSISGLSTPAASANRAPQAATSLAVPRRLESSGWRAPQNAPAAQVHSTRISCTAGLGQCTRGGGRVGTWAPMVKEIAATTAHKWRMKNALIRSLRALTQSNAYIHSHVCVGAGVRMH